MSRAAAAVLSRCRLPRPRYSLPCCQHRSAGRPSGRRYLSPTSAIDQLSRAPWGAHAPEHKARTLPTAASGAAPFRRLLCRRGNGPPSTEAPEDHGGFPASSGAAVDAARTSWDPDGPAAARTVARASRSSSRARLCRPRTGWSTRSLTPPVAPPPSSTAWVESERRSQEPVPQTARQCRRFPGPRRLRSTGPAHPFPWLARRVGTWGRHWCLWLRRQGPASDTRSLACRKLGPDAGPAVHRELLGHVPPVDFCSDVDPRARPPTLQTLKLDPMAEAIGLAGGPTPLRARSSQIAPGQGSHAVTICFWLVASVTTSVA